MYVIAAGNRPMLLFVMHLYITYPILFQSFICPFCVSKSEQAVLRLIRGFWEDDLGSLASSLQGRPQLKGLSWRRRRLSRNGICPPPALLGRVLVLPGETQRPGPICPTSCAPVRHSGLASAPSPIAQEPRHSQQ